MSFWQQRDDLSETGNFSVPVNNCDATSEILLDEHITYSYVYPVICTFGVLCNILNLIVLSDKAFAISTYTYLRALAVSDFLTLLFIAFIGVSRCLGCYEYSHENYWRRFYEIYIYLPLSNITGTVSIWITVALAIERYLFIKLPIKSKKYCTKRNAYIIIAGLCIGAILINWNWFIIYKINDCYLVVLTYPKNSTVHAFITAYSWIHGCFVRYIPSLILIVLSSLLGRELLRSSPIHDAIMYQAQVDINRRKLQKRLTVILVILVIVFLIGNIPIVLAHPQIASWLFNDECLVSLEYRTYRLITNSMEIFTLSTNFVIYCACNKKFGHVFIIKFQKCCFKKKVSPMNTNFSLQRNISNEGTPPN